MLYYKFYIISYIIYKYKILYQIYIFILDIYKYNITIIYIIYNNYCIIYLYI